MKFVIVGPGAIGCLFGGLLSEAGNEVYLLDKNPLRAADISKNGITIEGIGGPRRIPVKAESDAALMPPSDYLVICVKSYDTLEAARHAFPAMNLAKHVISIQNGLGNIEQIAATAAGRCLLAGTTSQGSTSLGYGRIRHAGTGITLLAPTDETEGARAATDALVAAFQHAKLTAESAASADSVLWGKAILNAGLNPVTAIWDVPNGAIIARDNLKRVAVSAVLEAAKVAAAMKIALPYHDPVAQFERLCAFTASNISSMLQDVRNHRHTEIDSINGYIVRQGRKFDIPVVTNEMLLARVRERETKFVL